MTEYVVTRKSDGTDVYRYQADAPIEWTGMEFATHDHTPLPEVPTEEVGIAPGPRRLTKQGFFDRLGPAAVGAILTMAKQSVEVEAWVKRLDLVTSDPDGTSVDLDDPRTVAGVQSIGAMLVQSGVVSAGWSDEVLA